MWSAAFSPDGTRVLTASKDATARIWDVASRRMVAELVSDDPVRRAAFSPDGKRVVTAPLNKSVRVWDVFPDTTALVSTARTAAPRCLTPAERETFFLSREPPAWCVEMAKWPYDAPAWKQWLADSAAARPRRCRLTCRKAGSCHSRKIYPTARSSNADRRGHHSTRNKQRWNRPVHQEVEMFELDVAQGTSQGAVSPFSHSQLNGRFCGETGPDRGDSCTRAIRP